MATTNATNERREQARRQAIEQLERATAELLTSDGWRAWLRVRATLQNYRLIIWSGDVVDAVVARQCSR